MDANGTRYHLLLGEDDWLRCDADGVPLWPDPGSPPGGDAAGLAWNGERAELTLRPRLFQFVAAPKDVAPDPSMRRGAGRDRYGNWYWIDEDERRLRVNSAGTRRASTFWPPEEDACAPPAAEGEFRPRNPSVPEPPRFRGLAVTEDHYLVVGVLRPAGLVYFDLHAGGAPQQLLWPAGVPFEPFDMAPAPGGGVLILDRRHARYWALDRLFNLVTDGQPPVTPRADDFQPRGGGAVRRTTARQFGAGVSLEHSTPVAAADPVAIEAMPDGTVLILDDSPGADFSRVFRYRFRQQLGPPASTEVMADLIEGADEDAPTPRGAARFTLKGYDFAFVPAHEAEDGGRVLDRLYVVARDGNQTFAFNVAEHAGRLSLQPLADYLPMRLFGGKALVRAGAGVFYDYGESWVPLVEQRRPRFEIASALTTPLATPSEVTGAPPATTEDLSRPPFHAFDGREPDCVWHRLMLDACIPPETEVLVSSRAANSEAELALTEWQPEPRPYLRAAGSELPYVAERYGTWEVLLQHARGRFLQLRLELRGNGRTTPRLRALRAYYPRFSYLARYLPAVYREDAPSASFLDRFLANFEGLYTALEDRIAAAQMLFDVRSAPPEALDWLAGWFGAALDPSWDGRRKRLFIKHAMLLFQMRGTVRGLQAALRLSLEDCPDESVFEEEATTAASRVGGIRIVEKFRTRRTPAVALGDPTAGQGPRLVTQTERWSPAQGGEDLSRRYAEFLSEKGLTPPEEFPVVAPSVAAVAALWQQFSLDTLGFVPASAAPERRLWQVFLEGLYEQIQKLNAAYATQFASFADIGLPADAPPAGVRLRDWRDFNEESQTLAAASARRLWQDFLARRYRSAGALNAASATHWPALELVSLPDRLPRDGAPLADWFQFESVVLAMGRTAQRFTVLLPLPAAAAADASEQQRRLELAARIVRLEKPADTVFYVKFYWQLFRLGEARLGEDTLIDLGSRAPDLMSPLVVGRGRLTESYLAPGHPRDVADRQVLGRDRFGA